jgi:hypothetical protein
VDVRSRFKVIYAITSKDQAKEAFQTFLDEFLRPLKKQLKLNYDIELNLYRIHSDMGRE